MQFMKMTSRARELGARVQNLIDGVVTSLRDKCEKCETVSAVSSDTALAPMTGGVVELDFADGATEILVDPDIGLIDERLKRLYQWWMQLQTKTPSARWEDRYFDDLKFLHNALHLYEIAGGGAEFRIRFVGEGLTIALGEASDRWISPETQFSDLLRPAISRIRELLKLETQMKAPLRTYSKSAHSISDQLFTGETLGLPFFKDGVAVDFVLAATVLTRAVERQDASVTQTTAAV